MFRPHTHKAKGLCVEVRFLVRATKKEKEHHPSLDGVLFGDAYGNRTHVTAVKGPCLNRLTNAPNMVAEAGFEPATCRV